MEYKLPMMTDEQVLDQMARDIQMAQAQQPQYSQPTQFSSPMKQNLVEWQLDFKTELEDIEHLLRCDVLKIVGNNEQWVSNPDNEEVVFNNRGVNELLREIRMFLNKNTVLSNYRDEDIKNRLRPFGHELRALIYNNYEEYGLTTDYKLNHFPIIVITIISMVESAYRRALNGEERRDLNSARIVNQTDPVNQPQMYPGMMMPQKQSAIKKLLSWV